MMQIAHPFSRLLLTGFTVTVALSLSGCVEMSPPVPGMPRGATAYTTLNDSTNALASKDYQIGPQDTINVDVFQEPALSQTKLEVNSTGNIALPLIGTVHAAGQTSEQLARTIEKRLAYYLVAPRVAVSIDSSASQKIIVQGGVVDPGVYPFRGSMTLLEALSLAKGESRESKLSEVVVFRTVNGQRMGAVFDVKAIRSGRMPDPPLQGNDQVIVGYSAIRAFWQDFRTSPLLGFFRPVY